MATPPPAVTGGGLAIGHCHYAAMNSRHTYAEAHCATLLAADGCHTLLNIATLTDITESWLLRRYITPPLLSPSHTVPRMNTNTNTHTTNSLHHHQLGGGVKRNILVIRILIIITAYITRHCHMARAFGLVELRAGERYCWLLLDATGVMLLMLARYRLLLVEITPLSHIRYAIRYATIRRR